MQLVVIEAASHRRMQQRQLAREASRIVRPWAWLALGAVLYMGYAAQDALSQHEPHLPAQAFEAVASAPDLIAPAPVRPRMVTKCIEDGATSYSDRECTPGAFAERIVLAQDPPPAAAPRARVHQQFCRDLEAQARRMGLDPARLRLGC
jgi:hypothetical protein